MSDHKKRVQDALLKYHKKYDKETKRLMGHGKKNNSPEKEVEKNCKKWLEENGFTDIVIYESKAVFSNGHWHNPQLKAGHADCGATCPEEDAPGVAAWLEFKAPGKLASFLRDGNERQRDFIIARIHANCFAVVVDSADMLSHIYRQWLEFRKVDLACARQYLLSCLPVRKKTEPKITPKDDLEF
jgi:hypothetical protein